MDESYILAKKRQIRWLSVTWIVTIVIGFSLIILNPPWIGLAFAVLIGGMTVTSTIIMFKPISDSITGIKRLITGELIRQLDTNANYGWTTMSLRVKRERKTGRAYVVLGEITPGNYQYVHFEPREFDAFCRAVCSIHDTLQGIEVGPWGADRQSE